MISIGIDPGLSGAIAVLNGDDVTVHDMPVFRYSETGFVKRAVDLKSLTYILYQASGDGAAPPYVFLERVNAMPGQGVAGMFNLGMSYWGAAGVAHGLDYPVELIRPQAWKQHFGLGRDKETARALAHHHYPDVDLHLKKHHGRAEALLIARYGLDMINDLL